MPEHRPTVDELLAAPIDHLGLPEGAIPVNAIVLVTYVEPGSDDSPGSTRLALEVDETMSAWLAIGMLEFAAGLSRDLARKVDDE